MRHQCSGDRDQNDHDDHDAEDDYDKGDGPRVDSSCNLTWMRIYKLFKYSSAYNLPPLTICWGGGRAWVYSGR